MNAPNPTSPSEAREMSLSSPTVRALQVLIVVTLLTGLAACLHIFRQPPEHYNFSHKLHAVDNEIPCLDCHSGVEQSPNARTRDLPTMKVCQQCHEMEIAGKKCGVCHIDAEHLEEAIRKGTVPKLVRYEHPLNFSHQDHVPRVEENCLRCHERVLKATRIADAKMPTMAPCMTCHQEDYDRLHCGKCHSDLSDPRYGPELGRFAHRGDWLRNHQLQSEEQDPTACAQCHMENFCADCHSGVDNQVKQAIKWPRRTDRHFIHRGDYVSRHPIDAQRDVQQCLGCHRINTCTDCHARSGVRWVQGGPDPWGGNHPLVSVTGGFHDTSPAAIATIRRNIVECAGCHEGSRPVCINCHADAGAGGLGINPHPPGFDSTFNRTNERVCRKCHTP
jgi:hypothetical protein